MERQYNSRMNYYASTFISGFQEVVEKELKKRFKDIEIQILLDGFVTYRTSATFDKIQQLRFLNNSFILLSILKKDNKKPEALVLQLLKNADFRRARVVSTLPFVNLFRITISQENQTLAISPKILETAESFISKEFRLRIHKTRPDIEFWFSIRREGVCFFGARITPLGRTKVRKYEEGELRQELAHLLSILSEPKKEDILLDPFAGSGAIPIERTKGFPFQKIYAADIDSYKAKAIREKVKLKKLKIQFLHEDALTLPSIEDKSITKIITDPPWGEYEPRPEEDINGLFESMLENFSRVLRDNGIVVLLLSRRIDFETTVHNSDFHISKKLDILVSGKKATVYILKKNL